MSNWVSLLDNAAQMVRNVQEGQLSESNPATHKMTSLANQLSEHSEKLVGEKILINIIALVFHMTYLISVKF